MRVRVPHRAVTAESLAGEEQAPPATQRNGRDEVAEVVATSSSAPLTIGFTPRRATPRLEG